jgi:hypothetical protein
MTRFIAALFVVALASGCAASSSDAASSSESAATSNDLASQTVVRGTLKVGETTTVGYQPDEYTKAIDGVPYLAWKLDGAVDASKLSVAVSGDFPGNPNVIVTDSAFNVLASASGHKTAAGAMASLAVPAAGPAAMVLVRDEIWVRPMSFDITLSQ